MTRQLLEVEQKALEINLDPNIYGTFSEIGAGQEVARYFFQAGAAAGTIAKTMSAYDKVYSDQIYGREVSNRYVCEARLYKMLDHEYNLMKVRLTSERPETNFFVFADTVAAINYQRTIKGNGWLGLRFQLTPDAEPNDLILHVRMLDNDNHLQQQAIGILGVNLVYAVYHYHDRPEVLIESLIDHLRGRVAIDMVRLKGPDFDDLDNRLICLWLVRHKMTEVAMFDANGRPVQAGELLYKKFILVVRGSYRPPTLVNVEMLNNAYQQFRAESDVDNKRAKLLTEITMDNLTSEGELDEKDFLARADLLNMLDQTVVITGSDSHRHLIDFLAEYKFQQLGLVLGVNQLLELFNKLYYGNQDGRLLEAFGEIFARKVKFYIYPAQQQGSAEMLKAGNLPVPDGAEFLYKHLLESHQIVDIEKYNPEILHIFSKQVLHLLQTGDDSWEEMVPARVAQRIKEAYLFNYPVERLEFDY